MAVRGWLASQMWNQRFIELNELIASFFVLNVQKHLHDQTA